MPEYERSIMIEAPPDEVFAFVSNLNNLPKYLPTTARAEIMDCERTRADVGAGCPPFHADGWFRVDPTEYMMEWSAGMNNNYSGWLEIEELDGLSEVTVHLSFRPHPQAAKPVDTAIGNDLSTALMSVKNIVERAYTHENNYR
ncbi:MAG: SRPBCC family protein [Capsulimonadaceae bacterium]